MPFLRDDPERWRAKAEECRGMAGNIRERSERDALLAVAEAYEHLAEKIEFALQEGVKPRDWISTD